MLTIARETFRICETRPGRVSSGRNNPTISILTEEALAHNNFIVAKALYADLRTRMPLEVSYVQKLALATYKAKAPTEKDALEEACRLLWGLKAADSTDTETLGLLQDVHKRLWAITQDRDHLDKAIWSSEKGFLPWIPRRRSG